MPAGRGIVHGKTPDHRAARERHSSHCARARTTYRAPDNDGVVHRAPTSSRGNRSRNDKRRRGKCGGRVQIEPVFADARVPTHRSGHNERHRSRQERPHGSSDVRSGSRAHTRRRRCAQRCSPSSVHPPVRADRVSVRADALRGSTSPSRGSYTVSRCSVGRMAPFRTSESRPCDDTSTRSYRTLSAGTSP